MRVTIKDIAEKAGVHRSTVDKVIHGREGVSDEVRARVKDIIREMHYTPNPAGRVLQKQGRTYRIAAILVEVDALPFLKQGLEEGIAAQTGFDIELSVYEGPFSDHQLQADYVNQAVADGVDAIVIMPINSRRVKQAIQNAREKNILVFMTNGYLEEVENACCVSMDSCRASRIAARLMGEFLRGKGQVAVISCALEEENNNADVSIRETGFVDYLRQICPEIEVVEIIESFEDRIMTKIKTLELLAKYKDLKGIYITCGGVAQVGQILKECDRWQAIKVISFEDYPEILELLKEGVVDCTLSGDIVRQGSWPIELIMDYLVFGKKPESNHVYTETKVLLKECVF